MGYVGFSQGELLTIAVNFVIVLFWPGLAMLALFSLRGRSLAGTALAIWVLIIVAVPFLGPLAYFVMGPRDGRPPRTCAGYGFHPGETEASVDPNAPGGHYDMNYSLAWWPLISLSRVDW